MKRTLLLFLTAVLSVASWAYDFEYEGLCYTTIDDSTAEVTTGEGYSSSTGTPAYTGDITIPSSASDGTNSYTVTGIAANTFRSCSSITKIEMSDNVTTIGQYAFAGCSNAVITLSENLTSLGQFAFQNCTSLTEMTIPDGVTAINASTFAGCSALEKVTIGDMVSTVATNTFQNCTNLSSLTSRCATPPTVAASQAFTNVPTSTCVLYVPSQSIDLYKADDKWSVFENVEGFGYTLSAVTLDATYITNSSAVLNGLITSAGETITEQGFEWWASSGDVKQEVYSGTDAEISVSLSGLEKNTKYTYRAYAVTSSAGKIYGQENTVTTRTYDFSVDGIYYMYGDDAGTCYVTYEAYVTSPSATYNPTNEYSYKGAIEIPETVLYEGTDYTMVNIGNRAFQNCEDVTSISIPSTATSIGQYSFAKCTALTEMTIPNNVTSLSTYSFQNDTGLLKITIGSAVESIGNNSFNGCTALVEIYSLNPTPPTITNTNVFTNVDKDACTLYVPEGSVGAYQADTYWGAFTNIMAMDDGTPLDDGTVFEYDGIKYQVVSSESKTIETTYSGDSKTTATTYTGDIEIPDKIKYEGVTYTVVGIGEYTFYNAKTAITSITLPSTITSLGQYSFYYCSGLSTLTIPDNVTSIGDRTFYNCSGLTSLELPEGLTSLGTYVFYGCSKIEAMTIPNGITTLENYLFDGCSKLAEINLPEGLTTIGTYVFYNCKALTEIDIPKGVTSIGDRTFQSCTGITSIELPAGLTSLGTYMFYGCTSLEKVNIPSGITALPNYMLYNCSKFTDITLHDDITSIGNYVFYGCSALEEITLPANLTTIGTYVFHSCSGLTEIDVPDGVTSIGTYAFYKCTGLTKVTLGSGLSSIGTYAFNGCSALSSMTSKNPLPPTVSNANTFNNTPTETCVLYVPTQSVELYAGDDKWSVFLNINGFGYTFSVLTLDASDITTSSATLHGIVSTDGETITEKGFEYWTGEEEAQKVVISTDEINIDATLTDLSKGTSYTYHAYAITEDGTTYGDDVSFSTGLYDILDNGIYYNFVGDATVEVTWGGTSNSSGTDSYTGNITIPDVVVDNNTNYTVVGIGEYAFRACEGLTNVTLPNTITYIDRYAFHTCSSLESVNIPEKVTSIGDRVFYECSMLKSINVPDAVTTLGDYVCYYCTSLETATIGNSVTRIGTSAFSHCENLKTATIGNSVETIGNYAFGWCSNLETAILPNTVVSIGYDAFYICSNLTELYLGTSLTTIGHDAFYKCSSVKSIVIPDSVTSIEEYTFCECSSAETITIGNSVTYIGDYAFYNCRMAPSITIPDAVTVIGEDAFYYCMALEDLTIGNSVESIGIYAFCGCENLKEVTLPNSLTTISDCLFSRCSNLESVTIGNAVTSIGYWAFYQCSKLSSVYSLNPEPPTFTTNDAFAQISEECVLYVPVGSYEDYSTADIWKDFFDIVEMIEFAIETLAATDVTDSSATLNGSVTAAYNDPITEKGFEYWTGNEEAMKAVVEGDEMTATVTDLANSTEYTYRAYAIMESGITEYGEEMTFETETPTGINGIHISLDDENVEGIYSTSGQKLNTTVNGVNIVRYADGTVKKIYVK